LKKADQRHGYVLTPLQVMNVAEWIVQMDNGLAQWQNIGRRTDEILRLYVEKYGPEVMEQYRIESEVVQGEVLPPEDGWENEGGGVDAPIEVQEEGFLFESSGEEE
jgi:hypothetical protein